MFLLPHEREQIGRDFNDLLNGEDSYEIIVHYLEQSGTQDAYGRWSSELDYEFTTRALVWPTSQRADRAANVERKADVDTQLEHCTIILSTEVDLENKEGVWFEVPDVGNFVPQAKPPLGGGHRMPLPLEKKKLVREFACGLKP